MMPRSHFTKQLFKFYPLPWPSIAIVNNTETALHRLRDGLQRFGYPSVAYARGADFNFDARLALFRLIIADWSNSPPGPQLWNAVQSHAYRHRFIFVSPHADDIADHFAASAKRPDAILSPLDMNLIAHIAPFLPADPFIARAS